MNKDGKLPQNGLRGPHEHGVRDRIILAARACFGRYGYAKTTVSDVAEDIGISKAYIYKFFDSKQAIGEAICAATLAAIADQAEAAAAAGRTAGDKLRRLGEGLTAASIELFFSERKLYDIAASSASEGWGSWQAYQERIGAILLAILREGRDKGEFETGTSIEEQGRAIVFALQPFTNPLFLQHRLDVAAEGQTELLNLILRSLSP